MLVLDVACVFCNDFASTIAVTCMYVYVHTTPSFGYFVSTIFSSSLQDGYSPLYVACQNGHKLIVDILLKNRANVNIIITVSFIRRV